MSRRKLFEGSTEDDHGLGAGPAYVTVEALRQHLAEFLLYAGRPVVIMRGRSQVGYFLPARCWRQRDDDPVAAAATRDILEQAGFGVQDIEIADDAYARMRQRTVVHPCRREPCAEADESEGGASPRKQSA